MRRNIIKLLKCPIDGQELELVIFNSESFGEVKDSFLRVKNGLLLNQRLKIMYPIFSYVPILLRFTTQLHNKFYEQFLTSLKEYGQFVYADLPCEKGEDFIQRTFTDEWNLTQNDDLSFLRDDEDLVNLNKHVWLKWITPSTQIERLLNVGCGIGKETIGLQKATAAKEIFAFDLNLAVLEAGERYKEIANMDFFICSLFHPPFSQHSFDLVYSQGVIHHTFSTVKAFNSISRYVAKGKYLFIWVYALEDHLYFKNKRFDNITYFAKYYLSRCFFASEILIRPWLSRSPGVLRDFVIFIMSVFLHPVFKSRVLHKDKWKLNNTQHGLRDQYTPMYAYRHSINEVVEWFEDNSFEIIDFQSPKQHLEYFSGKRIHGIGLTGRYI